MIKNQFHFLAAAVFVLTSASPACAGDFFDVEPQDKKDSNAAKTEVTQPQRRPNASYYATATSGTLTPVKPVKPAKLSMTPEISVDKDTEPVKPQRKMGRLAKLTAVPKTIAGVSCGVMVGVPVQIMKDTKKYTTSMHKTNSDDMQVEGIDLGGRAMAAGAAIPYGIVSGLVHGTIRGVEHGVQAGKEKPFSKESMSLSEPK